VHVTGFAPAHTPVMHESLCVHASPSSHAVPSVRAGLLHVPVAGLQTPAAWHESLGTHVMGLLPTQTPVWQASVCVHASPSSHDEPSAAAGSLQVPVEGLHTPTAWH
jgi:hypothetical protein